MEAIVQVHWNIAHDRMQLTAYCYSIECCFIVAGLPKSITCVGEPSTARIVAHAALLAAMVNSLVVPASRVACSVTHSSEDDRDAHGCLPFNLFASIVDIDLGCAFSIMHVVNQSGLWRYIC